MKLQYFLIFQLFLNIIKVNTKIEQIGTLKDENAKGIILVFSFSFNLLNQEQEAGNWPMQDAFTQIGYAINFVVQQNNDNDGNRFLAVLPSALLSNSSYRYDKWMNDEQMDSTRWDYFSTDNYMQQSVDAEAYEPERNFTSVLVCDVLNNLDYKKIKFKIYIFTNFVEKVLKNHLNTEIFMRVRKNVESISIIPMSVLSSNYYFYTLNNNTKIISQYLFHQYSFGPAGIWPISYLFAFSNTLGNVQIEKVLTAFKSPLDLYVDKHPNEINIQLSTFFNASNKYSEYQILAMFVDGEFSLLFNETHKLTIPADLIEEKRNSTSQLFDGMLNVFYTHLIGSQLPPEMASDAVKKPIHPKPRIVLITDFVEKYFLEHHLPKLSADQFEFKVYALNPTVFQAYKDKTELVFGLDPDKPANVPVGRNGTEPENVWETSNENKKGFTNWLFLLISLLIMIGVPICLITLCVLVIIQKRRLKRLNWLNQLERFKSEHIYAAYMEKKANSGLEKDLEDEEQELWEMGWDQVMMYAEQLGKGVYGEVYKGKLTIIPKWIKQADPAQIGQLKLKISQTQGTQIAVKILPVHASEKCKQSFTREIEIMKQLANGHRCMVHLIGCMSRSGVIPGLVLEYCQNGNLLEYVQNLGKQQEDIKNVKSSHKLFPRLAWQIADAMIFLASKNLVHRDLAARNVLLDMHMVARICDFGLCISMNNDEKSDSSNVAEHEKMKMPIRWMAPECLEFGQFSEKSDVWSFGILLHEMYSFGKTPFDGIEHSELLVRIKEENHTFSIPEICPEKIFEIMQNCLDVNVKTRPNFSGLQTKLTEFLEANNIDYGYLAL